MRSVLYPPETITLQMSSTDQQNDDALDTWMIEVDGVLVPDYDRTLTSFSEGDVVTGTVVRVDKDEILVDIGYKSEGVIPIAELSIRRSVNPDEEVRVGRRRSTRSCSRRRTPTAV